MTIVEFPYKKVALRKDLEKLKESLREGYEQAETLYAMLHDVENTVATLEKSYNEKILELSEEVGAENITLDDLEYATNVAVNLDSDGNMQISIIGAGSWEFSSDDGSVFEFIPEGDSE
jgi:hypothetical protein